MPKTARVYLAIIAGYTVAALLLTWPLLRHVTTHVPGDGIDDPSLAWNLWWIKVRLVDQVNLDIFHVEWMFHPLTINLGFYTLTPLNGLLSVPLQTAFALIPASNTILLSSFVLGGFGAYLLALQILYPQRIDKRAIHLAAFCAGMLYAFASAKLFYVSLGQFNIASSQWVPFCALYLWRLNRATSWPAARRAAYLAGLFLTLQAWAELTYASFLLIFAALIFLWSWWGSVRQLVARIGGFALLGAVFLLGISPFLWAMLPDLLREGDFFASGGGFADDFSADLAGYLLPTRLHPFWGHWVDSLAFPHTLGQQIFLGYTAMLLAGIGGVLWLRRATRWRESTFWLSATILFWWLTLGARARWLGEPLPIPGPFVLISQLPFFSGNRYPSRYSVMLLLCVAILLAVGVAQLLSRRPTWRWQGGLTAGLIGLLLVEQLSIPLPLSDFRVPPIYQRLAAIPGDFALLELPTGWRNGARVLGKSDILIMMQQWYQTSHGKRRLGGNTSRNPIYKFQYFTQAPLIGDLIGLMNAQAGADLAQNELARVVEADFATLAERNRALAPTVLAFLGVEYVMVHVDKATPALLRFVEEVLPVTLINEWQGTDWSGAPSTIRLYQVTSSPPLPVWSIDLADAASALYLAEGWSPVAWQGTRYATRPCADLLLNLPPTAGQLQVTLDQAQGVTFALNGESLAATRTATDPQRVTLDLAAGMADAQLDRFTLCTEQATQLAAFTAPPPDGWPIGQTGATSPVNLFVRSAGNDVGNFAQVLANGVPILQGQTGYNLVALDGTGTLLATQTFNTFASAQEADAMAAWLAQWPVGTIIAGAVMDEASHHLTPLAVEALAQLGVATDLRERFRWSHAFVGAVGSTPGTALEAATLLQPATVTVGVPIDAPTVYAGVRTIQYRSEE